MWTGNLPARALEALRAFCTHRGGNIALTFAIATVPIIGLAGAAVDYSKATQVKAALDGYADAAALSVVNNAAMSLTTSAAQKNAKTFFKTQADTTRLGKYTTVTAKVTDGTSGRTAVVSYTGEVPTSVMGAFGVSTINIKGSSTAASGLPTYIDFYLLLDNTPSMGVGATPSDVTKMVNNTPDQCAFACHQM